MKTQSSVNNDQNKENNLNSLKIEYFKLKSQLEELIIENQILQVRESENEICCSENQENENKKSNIILS